MNFFTSFSFLKFLFDVTLLPQFVSVKLKSFHFGEVPYENESSRGAGIVSQGGAVDTVM